MTEDRDNKEAIDKLLDIISKQNSLLGLSGNKTDEAVELKREWFKQVYNGIERTNESLEKAHSEILKLKTEFNSQIQTSYERLVTFKDTFNTEIRDIRIKYTQDLEKLHERIEKSILKLNDRLEKLPIDIATVKEDLRKELNSISGVVYTTIETLKEKELKPLSERVTNLYIKVAVISAISGVVGSVILAIISAFIKKI
jgi:hypothetical protein